MARKNGNLAAPGQEQIPVQPVDRPIICNPYDEPNDHWVYDKDTGAASRAGTRRPASYWYKTERTGSAQLTLTGLAEEERDDLPLVNLLRDDVRRWRESGYSGASIVTRDLLYHWARPDRSRRLFFCQREAVETIIYMLEIRFAGRVGMQARPKLTKEDLDRLLRGERPSFSKPDQDFFPRLIDPSGDDGLVALRRMACKMATGSGKTVVMSMLIAWAFCNRGRNPASVSFPNAVLICCPNLTVKERLQVLRPERADNYYEAFDIVPVKYRPLLQAGKVLVTNWHLFAPESEHVEGGKSYAVVNKGPETPDTFARRVLGDLYDRLPIMVLNDEGHHCWRPAPVTEELTGEERKQLEEEAAEARVWLNGLDQINNSTEDPSEQPGISVCVDLSATPFYIKGSGYPEGHPFPWIVSDFGLVDAIESGIVKIPRLPVLDTTGRPDPKYFKLWKSITENLEPGERLPGKAGRPKPEVVYREAEPALKQIAGQWVERYRQMQEATPGQERIPPVLILVCNDTDTAEVFYRKISGETEIEAVTEEEVAEVLAEEENGNGNGAPKKDKASKRKKKIVYGKGAIFPEFFSNTPGEKRTIRIDTKLLAEAESDDPKKKKQDAAEELRQIVASVGKRGQPGEHVRCVVSVSMLTEGWDANNVTQVLGVRAFGSQLLCEQVVGRGLRRMDYVPDPATGLLTEEYVDVYGIPFSVIPFKGRPLKAPAPDDRPKNHVHALPERKAMEIRFPVVEGYAFALRKNLIRCDIEALEPLIIEPNREPTATFVRATVGYQEGSASSHAAPFAFVEQNREEYYRETHLQTIEFQIARLIVDQLTGSGADAADRRLRVLALQSRHQLFPQVFRYVDEYVRRKVNFQNCHRCELGLEKYVQRMVERLRDGIVPDESEGEAPLMPILNRYKPIGTTAEVDFKTTRACHATVKSHIDQVVLDNLLWEASASFRLESSAAVAFYARNDHLGLTIPYEYMGIDHAYEPDFLVRLANGLTVVLEIKGYEDDQTKAKHTAAKRWVEAVNNWGQLGTWVFHVCRNPQLLDKEMEFLARAATQAAKA
ncbi:MAG: BPTD_3080 family restriction endonuclease [bacterium]